MKLGPATASYDDWLFDRLKHPAQLVEYLRAHISDDAEELDAETELTLARMAIACAADRIEKGLQPA